MKGKRHPSPHTVCLYLPACAAQIPVANKKDGIDGRRLAGRRSARARQRTAPSCASRSATRRCARIGLALSQLLTLYTTPVIYPYLDRLRHWLQRGKREIGLLARSERRRPPRPLIGARRTVALTTAAGSVLEH
jgi:hypothetical protein